MCCWFRAGLGDGANVRAWWFGWCWWLVSVVSARHGSRLGLYLYQPQLAHCTLAHPCLPGARFPSVCAVFGCCCCQSPWQRTGSCAAVICAGEWGVCAGSMDGMTGWSGLCICTNTCHCSVHTTTSTHRHSHESICFCCSQASLCFFSVQLPGRRLQGTAKLGKQPAQRSLIRGCPCCRLADSRLGCRWLRCRWLRGRLVLGRPKSLSLYYFIQGLEKAFSFFAETGYD